MMQQTSLEAFSQLKRIGDQQLLVYFALRKLKEATDKMLSLETGLPINVINPRRGELVKKAMVVQSYVDKCPITKRRAIFWKVRA